MGDIFIEVKKIDTRKFVKGNPIKFKERWDVIFTHGLIIERNENYLKIAYISSNGEISYRVVTLDELLGSQIVVEL